MKLEVVLPRYIAIKKGSLPKVDMLQKGVLEDNILILYMPNDSMAEYEVIAEFHHKYSETAGRIAKWLNDNSSN